MRLYSHFLTYLLVIFLVIPSTTVAGEFMFVTMANLFAKKITVYPFSAFEGQLFYKGEPAAFAKVTRTYDWDGTVNKETIEADAEGRFAFESVSVETKQSLSQFVSSQHIYVNYQNTQSDIWHFGKISEGEFGEFNGEKKIVSCEISNELKPLRLNDGVAATNCKID